MTTSPKSLGMLHEQVPDEDIDFSDIPELTDEFWNNARIVMPRTKTQITLRIDDEVLQWFKNQGKGYQTLINSVLKTYVRHQNNPEGQDDDAVA